MVAVGAVVHVEGPQLVGVEQQPVARFAGVEPRQAGRQAGLLGQAAGVEGFGEAAFAQLPGALGEVGALAQGVGGGKFSPDRSVTRQEAATLLTRQRKLSGEDTAADGSIVKQFTDDGTIADWAAAGVAYCAKTGLVQGKPGKVFAPKSTITRAEMATIMQRIAA